MKTRKWLSLMAAVSLVLSSVAFAQATSMTGKVLSVTNNAITLQTDSGVWQITRNMGVRVTGELKVGGTVTITCNAPDAQKKE